MECWRVKETDRAQPIPASRIAQERRWVLRVLKRFIFVSFRITSRSMWLIMGHQNGSGNSMLVRRLSWVSTWCQRAVDRWKLKVWRKPRYFVRANPVSQHVWLLSNWIVCWRRAQYTKEVSEDKWHARCGQKWSPMWSDVKIWKWTMMQCWNETRGYIDIYGGGGWLEVRWNCLRWVREQPRSADLEFQFQVLVENYHRIRIDKQ
jgi:hypothetical protein